MRMAPDLLSNTCNYESREIPGPTWTKDAFIRPISITMTKGGNRMKKLKEYRSLKVYEQYGYKYRPTPTILLKGAWLRECGFQEGDRISVKCEDGVLVIRRSADAMEEPVSGVAEKRAVYGEGGR